MWLIRQIVPTWTVQRITSSIPRLGRTRTRGITTSTGRRFWVATEIAGLTVQSVENTWKSILWETTWKPNDVWRTKIDRLFTTWILTWSISTCCLTQFILTLYSVVQHLWVRILTWSITSFRNTVIYWKWEWVIESIKKSVEEQKST